MYLISVITYSDASLYTIICMTNTSIYNFQDGFKKAKIFNSLNKTIIIISSIVIRVVCYIILVGVGSPRYSLEHLRLRRWSLVPISISTTTHHLNIGWKD